MSAPVLFFAFADDSNDPLNLLKRERRNIKAALRAHERDNKVKVEVEPGVSIEELYEVTRAYSDEIVIFHYGGHAGDTILRVESEDGGNEFAHAEGLAKHLGAQSALKLVFLNGCATKGWVESLLENGVPAVIATSVEIEDKMATEFAEQFYKEISNYASIRRSFDTATRFIETRYKGQKDIKVRTRGEQGWFGQAKEKVDKLPWSLYVADGGDEALDWQLPESRVIQEVAYDDRTRVNDLLVKSLVRDLSTYSEDLRHLLNRKPTRAEVCRTVVDCFPLPIGIPLRRLFANNSGSSVAEPDEMEKFSLGRLNQIYETFRATAQFVAFILMSDLWDKKLLLLDKLEVEDQPGTSAKYDEREYKHIVDFNSFFAMNEANYREFDYINIIKAVADIFDDNGIDYFLEELKTFKEQNTPDSEFNMAYMFMDALKHDLKNNRVDNNRLKNYCLQAEEALGKILKSVAFLAKYNLATIKNIEVIQPRHESPQYMHNHVDLSKAMTTSEVEAVDTPEIFRSNTDSKSVLFLKTNGDEILAYLSLSPFIIDLNALTNKKKSRLYLYRFQKGDSYFYEFLNDSNDVLLEVNVSNHNRVYNEVEKFKANIHNEEYAVQPVPVQTTEEEEFDFDFLDR